MAKFLVVNSRVKELSVVDGKPLNVSEDFYTKLSEKVEGLIKESCARAKANGRTTVMGKDV